MLLGVLIVLYIGTQLAASVVTAISADPMQRRIMLALPFVFAVFIINFEAGLIVYWITTNVWTIGQQLLVKKLYPKPEPPRRRRRRGRHGAGARESRRAAKPAAAAAATDGEAARKAAPAGKLRGGNGAPASAAALPAQEEEALGTPAVSETCAPRSRSWWPRRRATAWARPSGRP